MDPDVVVDARCMDYWLRRKLIAAGKIHVQVIVTSGTLNYPGGYRPRSLLFVESEEDVQEELERLRRVLPDAILIEYGGDNQALSALDKLAASLKRERRQEGRETMSDSRKKKYNGFSVRVVAPKGTQLNPGTNAFGDGINIVVEFNESDDIKARRAKLAAYQRNALDQALDEADRQRAAVVVAKLENELGEVGAVDLDQSFVVRVEVTAGGKAEFFLEPTDQPAEGTLYLARHPKSFLGGKSTCNPQSNGFAWTADDRTVFFVRKNTATHIPLHCLKVEGWEQCLILSEDEGGRLFATGVGGLHEYSYEPSSLDFEAFLAEIAEKVKKARERSADRRRDNGRRHDGDTDGRPMANLPSMVREANGGGNGRTTPVPTPSHVATPEDDADPTEPAAESAAPAKPKRVGRRAGATKA